MSEPKSELLPVDQQARLEAAVHSASKDLLEEAAAAPSLGEELALALLKRSDLPSTAAAALSKNPAVSKLRKVRLAIVQHPRTPRHISLPLLRLLFTFDLMSTALAPVVVADIKRAAEGILLARLESLSAGERLSLARRASGRLAAQLLLDQEARVTNAALENPRLNEAAMVKALGRADAPNHFVTAVSHHPKWSLSREIRIALLRNQKTPLARALVFARSLPPKLVRETLKDSRLPANIKTCLLRDLETRCAAPRQSRPARAGY